MESSKKTGKTTRIRSGCGTHVSTLGKRGLTKRPRRIKHQQTTMTRPNVRIRLASPLFEMLGANRQGRNKRRCRTKSCQQNDEPKPLRPSPRIAKSYPVPPHSQPQKDES